TVCTGDDDAVFAASSSSSSHGPQSFTSVPFTTLFRSIAGSGSGGGAGIQADLKTFTVLGTYGMSVITAVTAQNTLGVTGVYPLTAEQVAAQLEAVLSDIGGDAAKTGMLVDAEVIEAVAGVLRRSEE